eukprot:14825860-Alexandrium_andersonii.AAC.1
MRYWRATAIGWATARRGRGAAPPCYESSARSSGISTSSPRKPSRTMGFEKDGTVAGVCFFMPL